MVRIFDFIIFFVCALTVINMSYCMIKMDIDWHISFPMASTYSFCMVNFGEEYIVISIIILVFLFLIKIDIRNRILLLLYIVLFSLCLVGIYRFLKNSEILLIVSVCIIIFLNCSKKFFDKIRQKTDRNKNCYQVVLCYGTKFVETVGYFDTGNRIIDDLGRPVIVVGDTIYNKLKHGIEIDFPLRTINGISVHKGCEIDIIVKNKKSRVVMICSKTKLEYGAILHSSIFGG